MNSHNNTSSNFYMGISISSTIYTLETLHTSYMRKGTLQPYIYVKEISNTK